MDFSNKTCLIADHGLFVSWAHRLARDFGRVEYWTPSLDDLFPTARKSLIGEGFSDIKRVQDFFEAAKRADLIIFADVYFGDLLEHCRNDMNKRCWGAGAGEHLELERWKTKKLLEKAGLPTQNTERLIGIQALRDYLKENDDKYVKVSRYRGIGETWHHLTYRLSEAKLDEMEHQIGMQKYIMPFLVEDAIDCEAEPGWDGFIVDGASSKTVIVGWEVKDKAYIGRVVEQKNICAGLVDINNALKSYFESHKYRGWFSSEGRITKDGKCYPIDLTTRSATPAGESYQELYSNWAEIIWRGADGDVIEPKPVAKFASQVMMRSSWAERDWQNIYFPEKIRPWVKLYNACQIKNRLAIIPQEAAHLAEIGSVVGIGDTPDEVRRMVKLHAELIEGYRIEIDVAALDDAEDVMEKSKKMKVFKD